MSVSLTATLQGFKHGEAGACWLPRPVQRQRPQLHAVHAGGIRHRGPQVREWTADPDAIQSPAAPSQRRARGQKLDPQILQVNGNGNDTQGEGGSCFGDSGGPAPHGGYVVAVTSYGHTSKCRYLDGLHRVDIDVVQDWLATFGVRAAAR